MKEHTIDSYEGNVTFVFKTWIGLTIRVVVGSDLEQDRKAGNHFGTAYFTQRKIRVQRGRVRLAMVREEAIAD